MNILIDALPEYIDIDRIQYGINADYRTWVRFELVMLDGGIPHDQKALQMLTQCYRQLPPTMEAAISALIAFYAAGAQYAGKGATEKQSKAAIYSFEYDADYIYAAFLGQYGIDLQAANLHWWQFKALFKSLTDANQIVKIMEYRSIEIGKIKDKEQKAFYRKMKSLYKLPDLRTEEEKAMVDGLSTLF